MLNINPKVDKEIILTQNNSPNIPLDLKRNSFDEIKNCNK
jgi:hypothetical protein